jgi:uncharacterized membrane protein
VRSDGRARPDEPLERLVSTTLRAGVAVAAAVAGIGGARFLAAHGSLPPSYAVFHGQPAALRSINGIIHGAAALRGEWIIALGLLLLIATPVARVALLVVAFARQGDRLYVALSALVLAILAISFWSSSA